MLFYFIRRIQWARSRYMTVCYACLCSCFCSGCHYRIEMPLGQQDGAHGLRALVVGGSVLVRISIPPAGLPAPPSPVPVGAGSSQLVRGESARGSSTHFQRESTAKESKRPKSYQSWAGCLVGELGVSLLAWVYKERHSFHTQGSVTTKHADTYQLFEEEVSTWLGRRNY